MQKVVISTERDKLDFKLIHDFISNSYWGKGRSMQAVRKSIDNSLNFGIYKDGKQIGYARVLTDYTVLAYLMDVFIVESERGKGYSKRLLNEIMAYPELKNISSWKLATLDAHGLYKRYGFEIMKNSERYMERKDDPFRKTN